MTSLGRTMGSGVNTRVLIRWGQGGACILPADRFSDVPRQDAARSSGPGKGLEPGFSARYPPAETSCPEESTPSSRTSE